MCGWLAANSQPRLFNVAALDEGRKDSCEIALCVHAKRVSSVDGPQLEQHLNPELAELFVSQTVLVDEILHSEQALFLLFSSERGEPLVKQVFAKRSQIF